MPTFFMTLGSATRRGAGSGGGVEGVCAGWAPGAVVDGCASLPVRAEGLSSNTPMAAPTTRELAIHSTRLRRE